MSEELDFTQEEKEKKYIDRKGVYLIRVLSYVNSKDKEGYNKTHFLKFRVHDEITLKEADLMFWMSKENDSQERKNLKRKLIKDFLTNLGCNIHELKGNDLFDCAIGKSCKVALREKERIYYRKKDQKPVIITQMDYYYSGKADATLNANESKMYFALTPAMTEKYEKELSEWNKQNGQPETDISNTNDNSGDDDFPF